MSGSEIELKSWELGMVFLIQSKITIILLLFEDYHVLMAQLQNAEFPTKRSRFKPQGEQIPHKAFALGGGS